MTDDYLAALAAKDEEIERLKNKIVEQRSYIDLLIKCGIKAEQALPAELEKLAKGLKRFQADEGEAWTEYDQGLLRAQISLRERAEEIRRGSGN